MAKNSLMMPEAWGRYAAAMRQTEKIIRRHSRTFFFATALLPVRERQAVRALYAFCRASDDLVDCRTTRPEDFDAWRLEVDRPSSEQQNPLLIAWSHVRETYAIPRQYEAELLEGIRMDLEFRPYPCWSDLEVYCYRVAATVGLLSMPIIGLAPGVTFEEAAPQAIRLGIALQLTNILRDVGEDAAMGRVYLPLEDLRQFDLTLRDIYQRVFDQRFIALMQFEIARARSFYDEALPGIALLDARARPAVTAAALLYRKILNAIEMIGYQVYHQRAYTSAWQKVAMLPEIYHIVRRMQASQGTGQGA